MPEQTRSRPARHFLEDGPQTDEAVQDYIDGERPPEVRPADHIPADALDRPRPRRIVAPRVAVASRRPHIAATLQTMDNILWAEFQALEKAAKSGKLSEEDVRRFQKLSEVALKKFREEREQERHEKLDELTEDEIRKMLPTAMALLEEDEEG